MFLKKKTELSSFYRGESPRLQPDKEFNDSTISDKDFLENDFFFFFEK
jgi:hypothetical protein